MGRIIMLCVMLVSGTATSQLPEFSQQYRQRLGGAIDALEEVIADFTRDAADHGLTPAEAIERQKASQDSFVRARGESMENAETRLARLKEQQAALETAGPFQRLMIVVQGFDSTLAQATAEDYEPAVPVTMTGFITAGIGALAGLLGVKGLVGTARLARRRKLKQA